MKKIINAIIFFCSFCLCLTAQQNTDIQIKLSGLTDKECILGYYFGSKTYVKDTLKISDETIYIQSNTILHPGMYCLINGEGKIIMDFFVDKSEQQFSISSSIKNISGDIHIKNSENNTLFYQWIEFVNKNKHVSDSLRKIISMLKEQGKMQEAEEVSKQSEELDKKAELKLKSFEQYPELLVSRFMKAQQDISVPDKNSDGTDMSHGQQRNYVLMHYFDKMSLHDEGLLYTPIYAKKLEWFFNNMIPPNADSVIKISDVLIEQAKKSPETYKYVVWQATYYAESSEIMGLDRAFVYFVDHYYAKNDTLTMPDMRTRLMKRADELRNSLIGATAPNMMMQDSAFQAQELYGKQADFVIIFFFDPDCGHCKTETDSLLIYYKTQKEAWNFDIFAVCSDTSMQKMKKYIRSKKIPWTIVNGPRTYTQPYGTLYDVPSLPTLYLIDKNRKIVAKRLSAIQMMNIISQGSSY